MNRVKKRLLAGTFALMTILGLGIVSAPASNAASGTISGTVQCLYGNNNEVGVWVNAGTGTDGWASLSDDGNGGKRYSYTLSTSSSYVLNVGCSGTSGAWGATMYTPSVSGQSYDWICSYTVLQGYYCTMS